MKYHKTLEHKQNVSMYMGLYHKSECVANIHLLDWYNELSPEAYEQKLLEVLWEGKNEKCSVTV